MMQRFYKSLQARLLALRRDEGGAVALMVLAATLILFMMGLVIYDAGRLGEDKLEVQAAADAAAWSQSSVEARTMNMVAFANVGKRVTVGMVSFYYALWLAFGAILIATVILAVLCWIAAVLSFGSLTPVCEKITMFIVKVVELLAKEAPDLVSLRTDLQKNYFFEDIKAFDKYQSYMSQLTPWWSWSESFIRGFRNGATASSGWPVPKKMLGGANGGISANGSGTTPVDRLPISQAPSWDAAQKQLCTRTYEGWGGNLSEGEIGGLMMDITFHAVDYYLKTLTVSENTSGWEKPLAIVLAGLMAPAISIGTCSIMMSGGSDSKGFEGFFSVLFEGFGQHGNEARPWQLDGSTPAQWLMGTSNLVFAYRQSQNRRNQEKYTFLNRGSARDSIVGAEIGQLFESDGVWTFARSEISYQNDANNGAPDLWHPAWTARMRPVALPGEWKAQQIDLAKALLDAAPYMVAGVALSGATGGGDADLEGMLGNIAADAVRIGQATMGLDQDKIDGLAK